MWADPCGLNSPPRRGEGVRKPSRAQARGPPKALPRVLIGACACCRLKNQAVFKTIDLKPGQAVGGAAGARRKESPGDDRGAVPLAGTGGPGAAGLWARDRVAGEQVTGRASGALYRAGGRALGIGRGLARPDRAERMGKTLARAVFCC